MYFIYTTSYGFEFCVFYNNTNAEAEAAKLRTMAAYRTCDVIVVFISPTELAKHVFVDLG